MSHPYRWLIFSAWLFVLAVTVFDIRWAILYSSTANIWESNPIMLWVMDHFGVPIAAVFRLSTVIFAACLMPMAPLRSQATATLALLSVHAYLAFTYVRIYLSPEFHHYMA